MKKILGDNDKSVPVSYFSAPTVAEFATITGLMREFSQMHSP